LLKGIEIRIYNYDFFESCKEILDDFFIFKVVLSITTQQFHPFSKYVRNIVFSCHTSTIVVVHKFQYILLQNVLLLNSK